MESYINLDKNMLVNTTIGDVEVEWHDVRDRRSLWFITTMMKTPYTN